MAAMPGFLQLQAALTDPALKLDQSATWQQLADEDQRLLRERSRWHSDERQLSVYRWGAPPQDVLDQAVALRRRLDAQAASLGAMAQQMLLVVGHEKFTPAGYRFGAEGLEYLDTPDGGDGRVTLVSALLPGVRTWHCDVAHGKLPDEASAFDAYVELLERGETQRLPRLQAVTAGTRGGPAEAAAAPALVPNRPSRARRSSQPPSLTTELFARSAIAPAGAAATGTRLPLCVVNGSLKFVNPPLLLGHYVAARLSGTEAVVDALIGGAMGESLAAGLYPSQPMTQQVFVNTRTDPGQPLALPRPAAVVVVGLGEEGRLRPSHLSDTVRQGVLAYAQRESEQAGGGGTGFELAATLVGSGGVGVHVGDAAQAIAQGVAEANQRLRRNGWPVVSKLHLVELYLDRATEAQQRTGGAGRFPAATISRCSPRSCPASGRCAGPADSGYRGAGYDFITAVQRCDERPAADDRIHARHAARAQRGARPGDAGASWWMSWCASAPTATTRTRRSAAACSSCWCRWRSSPSWPASRSIVLQLDKAHRALPLGAARHRRGAAGRGAASAALGGAHTGAAQAAHRRVPRAAGRAGRDGGVLVIGEPLCDPPALRRTARRAPGGEAVAQALGAPALIAPDALQAVNALLAQPLRIVHISGHGEHRDDGSRRCGAVQRHRARPARDRRDAQRARTGVHQLLLHRPDPPRPRRAAQRAGRCARALRRQRGRAADPHRRALRRRRRLGRGGRPGDGVRAALLQAAAARATASSTRSARRARRPGRHARAATPGPPTSVTAIRTGATRDAGRGSRPRSVAVRRGGLGAGLALLLENEALDARYADLQRRKRERRSRAGSTSCASCRRVRQPLWGGIGAVAEAFGVAYDECGDRDAAIDWYQRAVQRSRRQRVDEVRPSSCATCWRGAAQPRSAAGSAAPRRCAEIDAGRSSATLQQLTAMQETVERQNLLGSAWKRMAQVEQGAQVHGGAAPVGAALAKRRGAGARPAAPTTCSIRR